jgi:type VI secretion system protein ImpH
MADDSGVPTHRLKSPRALKLYQSLATSPDQYDFHMALRHIDAANSEMPRLGESPHAAGDSIRIGQIPSVIFAPSTLASFNASDDGQPPRLSTYFFGMFGPSGALPLHLTEYARDRVRNAGDRSLVGFIDIFHHRMLSLYYRAWSQAHPTVAFDRPSENRFGVYVASLIGLGMKSLRDRDGMPDLAKLHFTGRLALQTRNAEGLTAIISDFFKLPVEIEQFMPDWVSLPRNSLCLLGKSADTGTLGSTATIGERIRVFHHKFRIRIGPMSLADYRRLLPFGRSLERLTPVVLNYVGHELSWDVMLLLFKEEVPSIRLGAAGELGWTSWLGKRRSDSDADDLILEPDIDVA